MKNEAIELYREELENLLGKIFLGDITPLVYTILKDSNNLDVLLKELSGETICKTEDKDFTETIQPPRAVTFEEWFNSQPKVE